MFGTNEIIVIALVVLVLFGASAIPKFARSLGRAKKEFEKGINDTSEEGKEQSDERTNSSKE